MLFEGWPLMRLKQAENAMKKAAILFLVFLFGLQAHGFCKYVEKSGNNIEYYRYSPNGEFCIRMVPAKLQGEKGWGLAFRVKTHEPLWRIDWFAQRIVLADDGVTLIRFGPWASDIKNLSDVAVVFYKEGKEIKKYFVKEFVQDPSRIIRTAAHYYWRIDEAIPGVISTKKVGFSEDGKTFTIVTVDDNAYVFSMETGEILSNFKTQIPV